MSEHQIKSRGDRLGIGAAPLYLLSETCIERILEEGAGLVFQGEQEMTTAELRGLQLEPNSHRTFFLVMERPDILRPYLMDIIQTGETPEQILGGLSVRLEPVFQPPS